MIKEIKLPEIADNVTSAVVLDILVSEGDKVSADDILAEMESDKASFELPSDFDGVVKEVKVSVGNEVKVGQVMFTIDTSADGGDKDKKDKEEKPEKKTDQDKADKPSDEKKEEPEKEDKEEKDESDTDEEKDKEKSEPRSEVQESRSVEMTSDKPALHVPASPAVRRLAREIGVDITRVKGSGPNDRVTEADVKAFAKEQLQSRPSGAGRVADDYELPDFSKQGNIRREKMDTIRKITARAMAGSWQSIPHVFQFDKADVTELEKFRKDYSKYVEKQGAKLTVTAILLKLTAEALRKFPKFNASVDMKNEEIIYKEYVNIGVAVDTDRGLLVPVIRDADKKSITELSIELNEMAEKARTKKIKPDELQGANFTISNLGGIGGTSFTPIVNRPAVAILGVSRSQIEPVFIDGEFKPRMMLPLSLSYDHRLIDGADGARFLRWLCEAMQNPLVTMF
ncbi:MAG: 2-oxo acid dehydrogenase subunit E2 [Bacteroidales bacterium]|nr:2-oxo acid dehydrogenase subunit E2 [Bacteroidales bacterium]